MTDGKGNQDVRIFYDRVGWQKQSGVAHDTTIFGVREDGPIRIRLHEATTSKIAQLLAPNGKTDSLIELGCGGNPAKKYANLSLLFYGVDFSIQGLSIAREHLAAEGINYKLIAADITILPFKDNTFSAIYCAHALYHIDSETGQEAAIGEALRILQPGGTAVFILANPYPVLFPIRLAKRLVASLLKRSGGGPLPYPT